MRRIRGALFAAVVVLPIVVVAPRAGAAAPKTTCKTISGTQTISPPLPKIGSPVLVKPTFTIKGAKLVGCTGGGVTSGTLSTTLKAGIGTNCAALGNGKPANIKGTVTIVWNTKTTTTVKATVVGQSLTYTLAGTVSAGIFKGSWFSVVLTYTIPKDACVVTSVSKNTFKQAGVLTIGKKTIPPTVPPFVFGPGMTSADQNEIKGDVAFAIQDEKALTGLALEKVTVHASTDAAWLAGKQCKWFGSGGTCVRDTTDFYASGKSAAQGGTGAIFLYWAAPAFHNRASDTQTHIAHELFHVLQYQTDHLGVENSSTPFDQVRPSGPTWLDEGAPEMIGNRVTADRGLHNYDTDQLSYWIADAKKTSVPLSQLDRLSQTSFPEFYNVASLAVDHLVKLIPSGLNAFADYYRKLGTGMKWPLVFQQSFGRTVTQYYDEFADYRAHL